LSAVDHDTVISRPLLVFRKPASGVLMDRSTEYLTTEYY
jgi:hypothetical protein